MESYTGKSIFQKVAVGKIFYYEKNENIVKRNRIEETEEEIKRFEAAKVVALGQLDRIYQKALKEVGEDNAAVFEVHKMMMEDEDSLESIHSMIREQKVNAEYAVAMTGDNFSKMFSQMDDEYMKARAADVKDISERLVSVLLGNGTDGEPHCGRRKEETADAGAERQGDCYKRWQENPSLCQYWKCGRYSKCVVE